MRRVAIALVIAAGAMAAPAVAADMENPYENPYLKNQAITLKGGITYPDSNELMGFWTGGNNSRHIEIGYERRVSKRVGIGIAAGYSSLDEPGDTPRNADITAVDPRVEYSASMPYVELKALYWSDPIADNRMAFYCGGGVGYYRPSLNIGYRDDVYETSSEKTHDVPGLRGLAGVEFLVMKKPVHSGYADAPVGIFLEYNYLWAQIDSADEAVVKGLNDSGYGPYAAHDLKLGGHAVLLGLRWHIK